MKGLRKLLDGFERAMTATAFAEAGEFDTAVEIMRERQPNEKVKVRTERARPNLTAQGFKK